MPWLMPKPPITTFGDLVEPYNLKAKRKFFHMLDMLWKKTLIKTDVETHSGQAVNMLS